MTRKTLGVRGRVGKKKSQQPSEPASQEASAPEDAPQQVPLGQSRPTSRASQASAAAGPSQAAAPEGARGRGRGNGKATSKKVQPPPPSPTLSSSNVATTQSSATSSPKGARSRKRDAMEVVQQSEEGGDDLGDDIIEPKKKSRKSLEFLNDTQTIALIDWVKLKSSIWKRSDEGYRYYSQDKMLLWEEACRYLNIPKLATAADVATEWKNIRDLYVKMDKEASKSGSGTYCPSGHRRRLIWQKANFLSGNFHHTSTRVNVQQYPWDTRGETQSSSQKENSEKESINKDNISNISSGPRSPSPPPQVSDLSCQVPLGQSRPTSRASQASVAAGSSRSVAGPTSTRMLYNTEDVDLLHKILHRLPEPVCVDPVLNVVKNFLCAQLLKVAEPTRTELMYQMLELVRPHAAPPCSKPVGSGDMSNPKIKNSVVDRPDLALAIKYMK